MGTVHTFVPRDEFEELCKQTRRERQQQTISDCEEKIREIEYELLTLHVRRSSAVTELLASEKILYGPAERHVKNHVESALEDLSRSFQRLFPQIYRSVTKK